MKELLIQLYDNNLQRSQPDDLVPLYKYFHAH